MSLSIYLVHLLLKSISVDGTRLETVVLSQGANTTRQSIEISTKIVFKTTFVPSFLIYSNLSTDRFAASTKALRHLPFVCAVEDFNPQQYSSHLSILMIVIQVSVLFSDQALSFLFTVRLWFP